MNGFSIEIDTNNESQSISANLVDSTGGSSFHLTSALSQPEAFSPHTVVLSSCKFAGVQSSTGFGELNMISVGCVSDQSLIQAAQANQISEQVLFNSLGLEAMAQISDIPELSQVSQQLLASLGEVSKGLAGDLSPQELSLLIDSLQGQLLDLNSASRNLFGELGEQVAHDVHAVDSVSVDELLAMVEVGTSETLDYLAGQPNLVHSNLSDTTLDALFTNPEAFPLTLDFSSQDNLDHAAELFLPSSSSISSNAGVDSTDASIDASGDSTV